WMNNNFKAWQNFGRASTLFLDDDAADVAYVAFTDLAAFYEQIDQQTLISDLRGLSCDGEVLRLLTECLKRWSAVPGRGLPQNCEASDVLTKVYMNTIDQTLAAQGHHHVRYSDDARFFCKDEVQAQNALVHLARLARRRGLVLQSGKSEILPADDARAKI